MAGTCHRAGTEDDISGWGLVGSLRHGNSGSQACCRAGLSSGGFVFCFQEFGPPLRNGEPVKGPRQSTGCLENQKMNCEPVIQACGGSLD